MQNPVHMYANNGNHVETFRSMPEALRYIAFNRLGPDWATPALPENPSEADRILLATFHFQREMRPQWRRIQFDRLVTGRIRGLPEQDWDGLAAPSVLALRDAFEEAGETGWAAVRGAIEGPRPQPDHAWLEHEDGRILDAFPSFGGADPIIHIASDDPGEHGYLATELLGKSESDPIFKIALSGLVMDLLSADRPEFAACPEIAV